MREETKMLEKHLLVLYKKKALVYFILLGMWQKETGSRFHSQQFILKHFLAWLKSNLQSIDIRPSNAMFAFPLLKLEMCDLNFGSICISAFPSGSPDLKNNYVLRSPVQHIPYELRIAV